MPNKPTSEELEASYRRWRNSVDFYKRGQCGWGVPIKKKLCTQKNIKLYFSAQTNEINSRCDGCYKAIIDMEGVDFYYELSLQDTFFVLIL